MSWMPFHKSIQCTKFGNSQIILEIGDQAQKPYCKTTYKYEQEINVTFPTLTEVAFNNGSNFGIELLKSFP